jgi:hypothetical protein
MCLIDINHTTPIELTWQRYNIFYYFSEYQVINILLRSKKQSNSGLIILINKALEKTKKSE